MFIPGTDTNSLNEEVTLINNAKDDVQHECPLHPPPLSNGVASLNSFHPVPFGRHFPYIRSNVVRDADLTQEVRRPATHEVVDPTVVPQGGKERNVMPNLQPNPVAQIPPSKDSFASNASTIDRLVDHYAANTPPQKIRSLARRIRRVYRHHNPLSPAPSIDSIIRKLQLKFNSRVTVEIPFSIELVVKSVAIKSITIVPENNA
uniref:Uncharacterized protein n=1 Tax=Panagrolaimus davidi TaxID=227884 RepID=A0A914P707_9BILA